MAIKVNKDVANIRIKEEIENNISRIEANAKDGIDRTDIIVDKDIYDSVISGIGNALTKDGTDFTWIQLRRSYRNMYGGWVYPISEDYGNRKKRIIKINS
jgi:hypothetical protein